MNRYTNSGAGQSGPVRSIASFLVTRPDNEKVTLVDRVVVFLSRVSMLLILAGVAITFFEVVRRLGNDLSLPPGIRAVDVNHSSQTTDRIHQDT